MYLNINTFQIPTKTANIKLIEAAKISVSDYAYIFYYKNQDNNSKNALIFISTNTKKCEIIDTIDLDCENISKLFSRNFIFTEPVSRISFIQYSDFSKIKNITLGNMDTVIQDDTLFVYSPAINKPIEFDLGQKLMSRSEPPAETAVIKLRHKPAKQMSASEKMKSLINLIKPNIEIKVFYSGPMDSIISINEHDGQSIIFNKEALKSQLPFDFNEVEDLLTLGINIPEMNEKFNRITVCDIRYAFKYVKTPEAFVSKKNYIVDNNILYYIVSPRKYSNDMMTYKELSITSYRDYKKYRNAIADKYNTFNSSIFYLYGNTLPDKIIITDEDKNTARFLTIDEFLEENPEINMDSDEPVSLLFPLDRILDVSPAGTETVNNVMLSDRKTIEKCQINRIEDDDEFAFGYNKEANIFIYSKPRF